MALVLVRNVCPSCLVASYILSNYCYTLNQNTRCWKINLRAWCWWQALKTTFCGHTHLSHLSSRHQVLSFQNLLCLDLFGCGRGIPNTVVSSTGGYQTNNCQTQCAKKICCTRLRPQTPKTPKAQRKILKQYFVHIFWKRTSTIYPRKPGQKENVLSEFSVFRRFLLQKQCAGYISASRPVNKTQARRYQNQTGPCSPIRACHRKPAGTQIASQHGWFLCWHVNASLLARPGACQQNCGGPLVPASLLARGFPSFFAICSVKILKPNSLTSCIKL